MLEFLDIKGLCLLGDDSPKLYRSALKLFRKTQTRLRKLLFYRLNVEQCGQRLLLQK